MNFLTVGSINEYTKNLKMQVCWDQKKKSGDVTGHTESLDEWFNGIEPSYGLKSEDDENKLQSLRQKVYLGGKLTQEEKRYLQTMDPMTYQKVKAVEQEQKAYEQKLRKCRTKEEVQRLKLSQLSSSMSTVNAVANNPNISDEKKLEICMQEKYRCDKMEQSTQAFIKSGEYSKLPSEAEQAKAEKELREAKKPKRKHEYEEAGHGPNLEDEEDDTLAEPKKAEESEKDEGENPIKLEEDKKVVKDEKTVELESPEVRKVRRARARRAYAKLLPSAKASQTVDVQA